MTTTAQSTKMNEYIHDTIKVLNDILDLLGTTKLVVTFNTTVSSVPNPDPITYYKGQSYGIFPVPDYPDHELVGWFTTYDSYTGEYSNQINDYAEVNRQGKLTLYAKWTNAKYLVRFDPGENGTVEFETAEKRINQKFGKLPNASKGAQRLETWYYTESNNTITPITSASIFTKSMLDDNGECVLNASYENQKTTISVYYVYGNYVNAVDPLYDSAGKRRNPDYAVFERSMNVPYNTEASFASQLRDTSLYNIEGHKFMGLAFTKYCENPEEIERIVTPFDETVLYACWKPNSYEIRYYFSDTDGTLLKRQQVNADEVVDILSPEGMVSEHYFKKFKNWKIRGSGARRGAGINSSMSALISAGAYPEQPVCNLVSSDNGYINLQLNCDGAEDAKDIPPDMLYKNWGDNKFDWSSMMKTEYTVEKGKEIELANFKMVVFKKYAADNYAVKAKIPTLTIPASYNTSGRQNVVFTYGLSSDVSYGTTNAPFSADCFVNVTDKIAPNATILQLLPTEYATAGLSIRYGLKLDLTKLSAKQFLYGTEGGLMSEKTYDYSYLTFDPTSVMTDKITNNSDFELSVNFRSPDYSDIVSTFKINVHPDIKTVGLSAVLPAGVKFDFPAYLPFKYSYLSTLSCGLLKENKTLAGIVDYRYISAMNVTEEAIVEPGPFKLKLCKCDYNKNGNRENPEPNISCAVNAEVSEGVYRLTNVKKPTKVKYTSEDIELNFTGMSAKLAYGTSLCPAAACVNLSNAAYFNGYFTENITPGTSKTIPVKVYGVYEFKASGNGTFPAGKAPFTPGYTAGAETSIDVRVSDDKDLFRLELNCGSGKKLNNVDFSRLKPNPYYKTAKFKVRFHDDSEKRITGTATVRKTITSDSSNKTAATVWIAANRDISNGNNSTLSKNPPISCKIYDVSAVNANDFGKFVTVVKGGYDGTPEDVSLQLPAGLLANSYRGSGELSARRLTIGARITSIGPSALYNCRSLSSVLTNSGITLIGEHAFRNCVHLKSYEPSNLSTSKLKNVATYAFANCKELTSFAFTSGIQSIGTRAFINCSSLQYAYRNSTYDDYDLTNIGNSAFYGCSSLKNFRTTNKTKTISRAAFMGCSSLSNVTILSSVSSIGNYAFRDCPQLNRINVASKNKTFSSISAYNCNMLASKNKDKLLKCPATCRTGAFNITNNNILSSLRTIGYEAFCQCNSLSTVNVYGSVNTIESRAFTSCSNLTSVNINSTVSSIGADAFEGHNSNISVTFVNRTAVQISEMRNYPWGLAGRNIIPGKTS